jgi:hypothetical protein
MFFNTKRIGDFYEKEIDFKRVLRDAGGFVRGVRFFYQVFGER